ncbi:MAG: HAMP domain-containing protein [Desulfobacteraceae bacterium]|nr:MAG: HAMP domain-containing protein [Desulfobacteraceae bacterium]
MLGIRQKFLLGFGGLLAIILIIGGQSLVHLNKLGNSIDVILRENYRSVIACQNMKEALERMDSGMLFILMGDTREGRALVDKNEAVFEKEMGIELSNITVAGEGEKAARLKDLFQQFRVDLQIIKDAGKTIDSRREIYFNRLFPLFQQIKNTADEILQMNQRNMMDANNRARQSAAGAREQMYVLLPAGALLAVVFIVLTGKWILRPIQRLIRSAEEIKNGNLDLVVTVETRDEIGRLSEAFNDMAEGLRFKKRSDQAKLVRIQDSTQRTFSSLPDAVAVIDPDGRVDLATESAKNVFGLKPGIRIDDLSLQWLKDLYHAALAKGYATNSDQDRAMIQHFDKGEERFFQPRVAPILDREKELTGLVITIEDVTMVRSQDELKRGVLSVASHQLKTPLTSVRMAIHLLLEEKVGPLNEKQAELLVAAREDSDRLHHILNDLLDIGRIEAGKDRMEFKSVSTHAMVLEALESFRVPAQDQGIELSSALADDLPEVRVDPIRIQQVFANLISNALKYTSAGEKVTVTAKADEADVHFSIADTGQGIPKQFLPRVFEQFFRVPGQGKETGAGLGLAIARQIVEAHGGTIEAESAEGKGSVFTFSLQRADRALKE